MIAVIADDLTGAAELGGIGLRFGLNVEVALEVNPSSKADLLIISTDTRSKPELEAVADMISISAKIAKLNPRLIFKKVDSALRGHIIPEIEAQLITLKKTKALIVAANPTLGRTVVDGQYLIHGKPLDQTAFKDDPEFPAKSSQITELLKLRNIPVKVRKHQETLPYDEIIVGDVASTEDLKKWASSFDESTLVAGGSGFFSAILKSLGLDSDKRKISAPDFEGSTLYVCGSAFISSQLRIAAISNQKGLVNYLPESLFSPAELSDNVINAFGTQVSGQLSNHGSAIVAVDPLIRNWKSITALELREKTSLMIQGIFKRTEIRELVIEGGSTATAVFKALHIKTLFPCNEYAPGVIRCRAGEMENLYITLKPGSYSWPKEVWTF